MKVRIEYVNDFGLGIAQHNGQKIFVPYVLEGEEVFISEAKNHGKFLSASLISIEKVSKSRQDAPCPYYARCGGCNLQHMKESTYKDFKVGLIKKSLKGVDQDESLITKSFFTEYGKRRRTTLRSYIIDNELVFGYFVSKTNRLIEISSCMLLGEEINSVISSFKAAVKNFNRSMLSKIDPIEISVTKCANGIDVLFKSSQPIGQNERSIIQGLPEQIIRVSWQCQGDVEIIKETSVPVVSFDGEETPIPPSSFLQVSEESQNEIIKFILSKSVGKNKILDLFSGVGTYSVPLAKHAEIVAIEGNFRALTELKKIHNVKTERRDLYKNPVKKKFIDEFDMVIINPPRNGASKQIANLVQSKIGDVILVYCDLQAFKRDSKLLLSNGWKLADIVAIDQFYQSSHMEVVSHFVKSN